MDCLNNLSSEQYESGEKRRIFAQLTDLLHFSQYYLTQVPNVNKQLWTYTQGLIHLAMIFHFSSFDQYTRQRKTWFEQMGVTPTTYKFFHINQHNTVYIKSPAEVTTTSHKFIQRQMFYIGSTKVDLCHREYNRHTQLNRYKQGKAIQVELAIRWWASQDNYSQFTTIAIKQFSTYAEAWTYEHAVIQQLEAPLNYPLVARFLTRNAFRYFYKPDKRRIQGINSRYRLYARIRRRLHTKDKGHHTLTDLRLETWKIMYNLASFTKQRFETSKQLGSGAYTNTMIYSFIRLTSYIEEPERSRIRSELKRIAKFRNHDMANANTETFSNSIAFTTEFFKTDETLDQKIFKNKERTGHSISFTQRHNTGRCTPKSGRCSLQSICMGRLRPPPTQEATMSLSEHTEETPRLGTYRWAYMWYIGSTTTSTRLTDSTAHQQLFHSVSHQGPVFY